MGRLADALFLRKRSAEWRPLLVYLYYRIVLSAILLAIQAGDLLKPNATRDTSDLLFYLVVSYCTLCALHPIATRTFNSNIKAHAFIVVLLDIIAITLFEHLTTSGTLNLSILIVVTVAAGGILIVGRMATLLAALATFAVLYEQVYIEFANATLTENDLLRAGMLGLAFFGVSLLSQNLSFRLRASEELTTQQAADIADLEKLNQHIIQRMRTGIIVVNSSSTVILINEAAWTLLGMPERHTQQAIRELSDVLDEELKQWRRNRDRRSQPFRTGVSSPEITASFTLLKGSNTSDVLIFLDDNTRLSQRAQQLKLASLGRLTASIAHEVRNPLGAISHAAQLLLESKALDAGDKRLADIIQQHSIRVNRIIENVLQLSRGNPAKPELMNLNEWLSQFIDEFLDTIDDAAQIDLQFIDSSIQVRVDPSQLHQVLTNLFQNGLRYSEKVTGKRELEVRAAINLQNERPFIDIIDKGPGIDANEVTTVFEPFYTTESMGSGLGLYISRELCEANQARLDYIRMPTQGSCFRISFSHPGRNMAV